MVVSARTKAAIIASFVLLGSATLFVAPAYAGDTPNGFYYGADSFGPTVSGSSAPYSEPVVNGLFGAYGAEVGTWTNYLACTSGRAVDGIDVNAANADVTYAETHSFVGVPFGTFLYFFAAGPGVDPIPLT